MKIIRNSGSERVVDLVRPGLQGGAQLDLVTRSLSLFAFAAVIEEAFTLTKARIVLPPAESDLATLGSASDRAARNRLQNRWLARRFIRWVQEKADVRRALAPIPQGAFVLRDGNEHPFQVLLGSLAFSTD